MFVASSGIIVVLFLRISQSHHTPAESGATTSHLPCDTLQIYLVTELWVRSLKGKVLYMLLRSSLLAAFWLLAMACAEYLLSRLSTKTALRYISPYECMHDATPDL